MKELSEEPVAEILELVLPNDANILGNVLGGKVMHLIDICAAIAATRHCRRPVVTASFDQMSFLHPIKVGELVHLKASLNRAFHTSMEIGVKVWAENLLTAERKHTSSAYLTFVALDDNGKPMAVPPYAPRTDEQKRRWAQAEIRRQQRLEMRGRIGGG
jgi:acyl-CoA hydrolase